MSEMKCRFDSALPYQDWRAFPPEAIVLVKNTYGERRIDQVKNLWWGYAVELGQIAEGVIVEARRLDTPHKERKSA